MDVDKIRRTAVTITSSLIFDQNMDLVNVFGLLATVCTIAMMLAGLPLCTQMMKEGTQNVQLFPFVAFFVNCMLWSEYGLLKLDMAVIIVNMTGCILEGLYILVYFRCTKNKMLVLHQVFGAFCIIFPSLVYAKFVASNLRKALSVLGMICIAASVVNFGSPLAAIKRVMQTKSTESMSLLWCLIAAVTAFQWTIYGYLRDDNNIIIPNAIGFGLGVFQLALIYRYKPKVVLPTKSSDVTM
ncbi:sugar transporter SWEET1-like isoform X2 [Convolutriloba macropyga]|uniref:sugar transporter SWEET1-like isoform X2 n=1 Tax=Convolutriloba macropyga TaxID=536237 RepID=UPI003F51FC97